MDRISLTINEGAETLGISVTMLRKLVKKGEIPYFRCGRKVLFSVDSLSEWVNSREKMYKK